MQTANFFAPGFDEQVEQQNIERQRKMADLLRQQTAQGIGDGRMVGRHYVAPHWLEGVAQMLQAGSARRMEDQASEKQKQLAEAIRTRTTDELGTFTKLLGGEGARDIQPLTPNDDEGNPMPVVRKDAVPGDLNAAYQFAAKAQTPALQQFGVQGALSTAQEQAKLAQAEALRKQYNSILATPGMTAQKALAMGVPEANVKAYYEAPNLGKTKGVVINGQLVNEYDGTPIGKVVPKQADAPNAAQDLLVPDPNNPGKMIPNTALVGLKKDIAAAGASKNSNTVINKGPEAFDVELAKLDAKQLDQWRDKAEQARSSLATAQRLRDAEASGAYSGGLAEGKLAAANLINGITGIEVKGLVGSQLYNAEASKLVLEHIKGLGANPSNADRDFIQKTVPQLATSQEARQKMVEFIERAASGTISTFDNMNEYARKNKGLKGFKYPSPVVAPAAPTQPTPKNKPSVSNW